MGRNRQEQTIPEGITNEGDVYTDSVTGATGTKEQVLAAREAYEDQKAQEEINAENAKLAEAEKAHKAKLAEAGEQTGPEPDVHVPEKVADPSVQKLSVSLSKAVIKRGPSKELVKAFTVAASNAGKKLGSCTVEDYAVVKKTVTVVFHDAVYGMVKSTANL